MLRLVIGLMCVVNSVAMAETGLYQEPQPHELLKSRQQISKSLGQISNTIKSPDFMKEVQEQRAKLGSVAPVAGSSQYDFSAVPRANNSGANMNDVLRAAGNEMPTPEAWTNAPLVLVSFSMPDSTIKSLIAEASKVGAKLVLRGALDGDIPKTINKIKTISEGQNSASIVIDPTVFKRFSVTQVPTFILPLESVKTCTEVDCEVPNHVIASGSATLKYFLEKTSRVGDDQEKAAADQWLVRYKETNYVR